MFGYTNPNMPLTGLPGAQMQGNLFNNYAATKPPTQMPPGGAGMFDISSALPPQPDIVPSSTPMFDPAQTQTMPMASDPRFAGVGGDPKRGAFDQKIYENRNVIANLGHSIASNPFGFGAGVAGMNAGLPAAMQADKENADLEKKKGSQHKLLEAMGAGLKLTPQMLDYFADNPDAADAVIQAYMVKNMRLGGDSNFRPLNAAERKAYGLSEKEGGLYQIDDLTGEIKMPGGRGTTVNNNLGGDNKFWGKFDEDSGKNVSEMLGQAHSAQRSLIQLGQLEQHLSQFESGGMAALKNWLGSTYGIATEGLSDIQAAEALISQMVPGQRPPGSGTMSDADLILFKNSLPKLINTPEGNRRIIATMKAIAEYDIKRGQIIQKALAARGSADEATSVAEMQSQLMALPNPLEWVKSLPASITGAGSPAERGRAQEEMIKRGWKLGPDGKLHPPGAAR